MSRSKSEAELIAASNLNFAGSYRKLAQHCPRGEVRNKGSVMAFVTGVPISMFNGCLVFERPTAAELATAAAWVTSEAVPYHVWIDDSINPLPDQSGMPEGFVKDAWTVPGMVLQDSVAQPAPPAGVTVAPVGGADLVECIGVFTEGGFPAALAETLFSPAFAADPDVQLFTARVDGRAVGTALAIRTGAVAGVYAVGTLEHARRRGVGTAATWAAVAAGRAWGCETIVLQSSEMGYPVYSAMGFRTVVRYAEYGPQTPPAR